MRRELLAVHARRGSTVVELLVGSSVLALLIGCAGMLWGSARGANLDASDKTRAELQLRRALEQVADELAMASRETLFPVPDAEFGTAELVFQQVRAVENGNPVRGPLMRIRHDTASGELLFTRNVDEADELTVVLQRGVSELAEGELPNGEDDNGNGLRDEGGFSLSLDGELLTIRLSTAAPRAGGAPVLRTLETSLRLRN